MINKFHELSQILDEKAVKLVDIIKNTNPEDSKYKNILENFDITLILLNNINMMLSNTAKKAAETTKESEKEEEK